MRENVSGRPARAAWARLHTLKSEPLNSFSFAREHLYAEFLIYMTRTLGCMFVSYEYQEYQVRVLVVVLCLPVLGQPNS